ncbi:cyclopropane mycolic acid synthase 3 domain protein [Mycobacterium xenopi 3993]|nr:cyclopropane mycolic acid synthase 3 domain protein [Mycobacterium xenopi 3993]
MMLLHTITRPTFSEGRTMGLALTREVVRFAKFILDEIFPAVGCRRYRLSKNMPARLASG